MQLKKLELHGFKSFADETCFLFDPGLTVLVGPNGCGKSNVVDAVKWVLGEMSPRSLRGDELLDVIFNGSETRQACGCAEVSLTFANEDGRLPIEYSEVTVTRRLYRSGESEYLLNKQPCRLKDIRELFMDTGVGMDFYSVVEQGRIETLLQSNPKDRRALLDEAAGISKYKAKKREAEGKLERAAHDLARVTDIIKELDSEIRSLKIQAAKAEKYKRLSSELRRKRAQLALRAFNDLKKRKTETEALLETLQHQRDESTTALMTARHEVEISESRVRTAEDSVRSGESARQTLLNQAAATDHAIAAETERLAELKSAIADRESEMESVRTRIADLSNRREQIKTELAEIAIAAADLEAQLAETDQLLTELVNACEEAGRELARRKNEIMDTLQKRAGYQNELTAISLERKNLFARRERSESRASSIATDLRVIEDSLAGIQQELAGLDTSVASARADLANHENRAMQLRSHQEKLLAAISSLHDSLSKKTSRRETLEEMEQSMAGVEPGARSILMQAQTEPAALDGVLGLLGKLLDVDTENVRAVEAALGSLAHAIVAQTSEAADRLLRLAKASGTGNVTIVDLSSLAAVRSRPTPFANPFEPAPPPNAEEGHLSSVRVCLASSTPHPYPLPGERGNSGMPGDSEFHDEGCCKVRTASAAEWFPSPDTQPQPSLDRNPEPWEFGGVPSNDVKPLLTAADLVRATDHLQPLVARLLSHYIVVENLEEAEKLIAAGFFDDTQQNCGHHRHPHAVLVTRRGELVLDPGIIQTAPAAESQPGLLSRKVELQHLSTAIEKETEKLSALEHEMKLLESDLAHLQKQSDAVRHTIYDNSMLIVEKRKEREALEKRQSALQVEQEIIRLEIQEIDGQTAALTERERSVSRLIGELDLLQKTLETTAEELMNRERDYAHRRTEVAAKKTDLQIQLAEIAQRRTFLEREDSSCAQSLREAEDSVNASVAAIAQMRSRAAAAETEVQNKRQTLELLQAEAPKLEERLAALHADLEEARTQLAMKQKVANVAAEQLSRLDSEIQNARMLLQEHSLRLEALKDRVQDELGVELEQLAAEIATQQATIRQQHTEAAAVQRVPAGDTVSPASADMAPEVDTAALTAEIEDIRQKLETMANVNLSALDQLKEVEQRSMFLKAQQEDLVKTKAQLEEFIRRVNRECREKFLTTLTVLRENFNAMFRKLFGGGKVDIVLDENVDPLDSGIEIMAKPPGKELTSISLMSGGEKSLTTVALVMGIFMLKPSPFCILDEADAALDETNIDRFIGLLKEFLANTQFVLITHNKRTISAANVIYGITMEEPGVSKKISVRFIEEVEALLDNVPLVPATALT